MGDIVKVTGEAVKGWDRNPPHKIKYFSHDQGGDLMACLNSEIPVCGPLNNTSGYRSGTFYLNEFELKKMNQANKLICLLFGHKYRLLRSVTSYCREIKCRRCKAEFVMNDDWLSLLPLDDEFKKMHDEMIDLETELKSTIGIK